MATKKRKYPKKPSAKASLKTLENYLVRVKAVDKFNSQIESDKKKIATLRKRIAAIKK